MERLFKVCVKARNWFLGCVYVEELSCDACLMEKLHVSWGHLLCFADKDETGQMSSSRLRACVYSRDSPTVVRVLAPGLGE